MFNTEDEVDIPPNEEQIKELYNLLSLSNFY